MVMRRACAFGIIVSLVAGVAQASNVGSAGTPGTGGTTNGVWYTPDRVWNIGKRSLTSTYNTGVEFAVWGEYAPTRLNPATYVADSCYEYPYDVCVYDDDYGDIGLNGWNACAGATSGVHPSQTCSLQWVRINLYYSPPAKRIACHELGHSVGLRHTADQASCLKTTASGGTSSDLTPHDIDHLNARY